VLFVGNGPTGPENVTRRATDPADPVQRRDFAGSDKRFPPILPGNPATVWIVEGGVDALALRDLASRRGEQPPTVIVSGGSKVRGFLENEAVRNLLVRADKVVLAFENEPLRPGEADAERAERQAQTDGDHDKQAAAIMEITGREPVKYRPPAGAKDLADLNEKQARRPAPELAENGEIRPADEARPAPQPGADAEEERQDDEGPEGTQMR
jgi:hypothetical protein